MPVELEKKIRKSINKNYNNLSEDRKNAILYSILRKTGWKPSKGDVINDIELSKEEKVIANNIHEEIYREI